MRIFVLAKTYWQGRDYCQEKGWQPRDYFVLCRGDKHLMHGLRGNTLVVLPGAQAREDFDELVTFARAREFNIEEHAE